jgi:signal transduction histidine kinase/GAF domain-containing protein
MAANKDQRWARQLTALKTIAVAMSQSQELEYIIKVALAETMRALGIEFGWVHLVEGDRLILKCQTGLSDELVRQIRELDLDTWTSQKTLIRERLDEGPREIDEWRKREGIQRWLSIPLKNKEEFIGCLALASRDLDHFETPEVQFIETVSHQLSVAVENARLLTFAHGQENGLIRLYEETQRRVQELAFLNEASRTVTSSLDLEQVLTTVMQKATDVLKVEATSILLLDDEDKELVLETVVGPQAEKVKGLRFPLGQGIAGWVAREGQPLLVPDVKEEPRFYPGIDQATGFVTKSVLAVPLKVKGRVIGVIEAVNKTEGDFSQTDVELLSSMTRSAAIAIENARLYEAIEEYSRILEEKVILRTRNLAEEKGKLDAILRNIADGLLVIDTEDRLILANPVAARVLGFKLEDAIGHKIDEEVLAPLWRDSISDLIHQPDPTTPTILEIPDLNQIGPVRCWEQKDCQQSDCPAYGQQAEAHCWLIPGTRCSRTGPSTGLRTSPSTLRLGSGQAGLRTGPSTLRQGSGQAALRTSSAQDKPFDPAQDRPFDPAQDKPFDPAQDRPFDPAQDKPFDPAQDRPFDPAQDRLRAGPGAPEESASEETGGWHPIGCPFYSKLPKLSIEARASTVENERGEVLGTVIVTRDITALKEMDRLKTLFVSNVSHELRTPITIIKLTVSNFLQYYARLNDQKRMELLETTKRQADILHRLIENILTLSRLDTGNASLQKAEFDLAAFCRTLLSEFALAAAEKDIALLDDGLQEGTTIWADQERIGQVVRNLLSNAIKFTPTGGQVMIAACPREGDEGMVEMRVSDTGSGISPRDQAHLFERFYRSEATARGIPGTGLGLAIVKEIVEEHGGSVSVESKLGEGSTFTVWLPGRGPGDGLWPLKS